MLMGVFSTFSLADSIDRDIALKSSDIPLHVNMPYLQARQLLLQNGWKPEPMNTDEHNKPVCHNNLNDCKQMYEIDACLATDDKLCLMYFADTVHGGYLEVKTTGGDPTSKYVKNVVIKEWNKMGNLPDYSDDYFDDVDSENATNTDTTLKYREKLCLLRDGYIRDMIEERKKGVTQKEIQLELFRLFNANKMTIDNLQEMNHLVKIAFSAPDDVIYDQQRLENLLKDLRFFCMAR